ncbi:MAG: aspartate/glutamate racemase family protein [Gammaproteobacteria bacterium]|nr:aspartate/glutamate racemase family protein [Gammaproteobacteria bacterium]
MIYRARRDQVVYGQAIGIIMMETFMPFPPGSPGNASTFRYPVRYELVRGATMERVVYRPDPALREPFLAAGRRLVADGVRAVSGNCGFMIQFQDDMARELPVPVFMSSLLQLPFVSRLLGPREKVGIITASRRTLTEEHLLAACGGADIPLAVAGMEERPCFHAAIHAEQGELDFDRVEAEVVAVALELAEGEGVKAILFECTDLPPYAAAVQDATGLPVFDFTTMADHVFSGLVRRRFDGWY